MAPATLKTICKLVERGETERLQEELTSLDHSLLLEGLDSTGSTVLHRAAIQGHVGVIKALLGAGMPADVRMKDGKTPLHECCNHGHLEAAKELVEAGANIIAHKTNGWTPLMYASNGGYLDLVMLLLSTPSTKAPSHFNINEQNREGATALYLACREGQVSVVEVLITNGADVNQATKTGRSPLHVSVMNKHRAVIKTLLSKGADIHARDKLKGTLWHESAAHNDLDMMELLLERKVDMESEGGGDEPRGQHPIHHAALHGSVSFLEALLTRHLAPVDCLDRDHATPLYYACTKGHTPCVRILLDNGADPNLMDPGVPRSCLHVAVGWRHQEVAALLLSRGANPNVLDKDKETPLHLACRGGDDAMVRVLLEAGADWKFVSEPEGGKDARGIAAYYGKSSVVSIIDEWQNEDKHKGQAMS